jgi:iron complex outermembrane receptor protein
MTIPAAPRGRPLGRRLYALPLLLLALAVWTPEAKADPKDDARRHFVAGLAAAQAKEYETALEEFKAAQDAYPHPASLYNIARSYADLGDLPHAIEYYELYADAAPDKAADVLPVIATMKARLKHEEAPVEVAAAPAAPAPTATVDSAEVDQLAAIAKQLQDLSAAMAARATAPPPTAPVAAVTPDASTATPTTDAATTDAATEPTALPDQGDLLSDAYERVVVTASRYGQSPLDSPSTVTILTEQDIKLSGVTSLPDLLRRVVGVDVMALSAGQSDVSIRGFNHELSNKVLVLVDGRSVYLDFLGTVVWGTIGVSLEEIERIEVIRGPGSAIYGANAVTGVVNIITKVPGEGQSVAHVEAGAPGYAQASVVLDGRKKDTSWRMSAGWDQTGRWSAEVPVTDGGPLQSFTDDQDMALKGARADGRVDRVFLDKGLASVSAGYVRGMTEFYPLGALGDYGMEYNGGFARGDLAYGPVHLRTFWNGLAGPTGPWASYIGGRSLQTTFDSDTIDTELEANGEIKTGPIAHRVNAGLGYRYKRIAWGYLQGGGDPIVENHFDAFLQEQAKVGPVAVVASLRADKAPLVPLAETISPRGAAIIRVAKNTSVRVTGGTSYRSPTMLETYTDLNQPTTADGVYVRTFGDTSLLPERILTGEVGLHDESTTYHMADVAAYVNRVTDLIGLSGLTPDLGYYDPDANGYPAGTVTFVNLDPTYLAYGAEFDARVFPIDGVDLYANLALERIAQDEDGTVTQDQSTSAVKVNAGASYRTPFRVDVSADLNYVSPQTWVLREYDATGTLVANSVEVPARTIVSARVAGRPFADERLELAVSGWNLGALGGNTFREHPKGQLVGPRYWGEVTWRF